MHACMYLFVCTCGFFFFPKAVNLCIILQLRNWRQFVFVQVYLCISVFGPIDQFSQNVFHVCFASRGLHYFLFFKISMAGLQTYELGVLPAPHIVQGPEFMYGNTSCKTWSLCDGNFSVNVKQKADSYIMQQISLIQHVWDQTCAELSNILDYQMVHILT